MRISKAYLQNKFTAQKVTEVSFFEGANSRSRAVVNGFWPGWNANFLLSSSVSFLVSTFECLLVFFKRAREREVKLCYVVYEV